MRGRALFLAAAIAALVAMAPEPTTRAGATITYNGWTVTPWTCRLVAQTTTKQCQALTAGMKTYVTDFTLTAAAVPQTLKIITGTGSDCAGAPADLTHAVQFAAVGNVQVTTHTPLQPAAAGLAVCVAPSAATSYSATLTGFAIPQ